jgi:N-acetylglucosaminyldiphosphoundecaprenol N-acetyl-beta-D-mannosaminyltransferase
MLCLRSCVPGRRDGNGQITHTGNQSSVISLDTTPNLAHDSKDRLDILGVRVRRTSLTQTLDAVEECIIRGERRYGVFINVYNVIEARQDASYRQAINDADFPMPDGVPLVWASRVLGDPVPGRVCGPDFLVEMNKRAAQKGYTVYIMCGGDRKAERTAEAFQAMHPNIKIVGAWTPPWGPIEGKNNEYILGELARTQPDILWVGLGAPLQERWVWTNRERIEARFTGAVGGAFDYHIGMRKRAPVWMQHRGLEFWYRIGQDPTLFWKKKHYADFHKFVLPVMWQGLKRRLSGSTGAAK